jgi:hypothetical protein
MSNDRLELLELRRAFGFIFLWDQSNEEGNWSIVFGTRSQTHNTARFRETGPGSDSLYLEPAPNNWFFT